MVWATQAATSFGSLRRPFRRSTINSPTLTGDSHKSFRGISYTLSDAAGQAAVARGAPKPDVSIQKQLHREASQSSQLPVGPRCLPGFPAVPTMDPSRLPVAFLRRWRNNFSYGPTEACDSNRLARLADLFDHAEAFGFELGNGYFFHGSVIPWSMTMVNLFIQDG